MTPGKSVSRRIHLVSSIFTSNDDDIRIIFEEPRWKKGSANDSSLLRPVLGLLERRSGSSMQALLPETQIVESVLTDFFNFETFRPGHDRINHRDGVNAKNKTVLLGDSLEPLIESRFVRTNVVGELLHGRIPVLE
jgi:hypothetical protein